VTALRRSVLRFRPGTQERLDEVADLASRALKCNVSRAAVTRAAVEEWVDAVSSADPALLMASIQAALVKRGRKRR
jgi:ribonuclease PH